MSNSILNTNQTRVDLFEKQIKIDKTLPKYKVFEEENVGLSNKKSSLPFPNAGIEDITYSSLKEWYESSTDNIKNFNVEISEKMRRNLEALSMNDVRFVIRSNSVTDSDNSLKSTIVNFYKKRKEKKENKKRTKYFDVISFFENVKLSSVEEGTKYKNRIHDYISCIGYAEKSGQTALKEKLFENLVINKYESILYAKGFDRALSEETVVKLAKNSPKALCLDYIANYIRTIPIDVINKIIKANEMEVFDNYAIMYYDPEGNSTQMTNKEKKAEIDKAKDPILFGVIAGSNKLYYICDWIDEMYDDDMTWDKVVDILGKEIVEKNVLSDTIK